MLDRRLILNFDWPTLVTAFFISAIGVVNIYSSTYPHAGAATPLYLKQMYWTVLGLGLAILALGFDYRTFVRYAYPFYLFCLLLLILVMIFGRSTSGSQRWLQLGFFSFQPSELTKIALILALTRFCSSYLLAPLAASSGTGEAFAAPLPPATASQEGSVDGSHVRRVTTENHP